MVQPNLPNNCLEEIVNKSDQYFINMESKKQLSPEETEKLVKLLKARFEKNMNRHEGLEWAKVQAKLEANAEKLWSLNEMERTGGEPDIIGIDIITGKSILENSDKNLTAKNYANS